MPRLSIQNEIFGTVERKHPKAQLRFDFSQNEFSIEENIAIAKEFIQRIC